MPRFSEEAIDTFTTLYYQNFRDPDKLKLLADALDNPLDKCFVLLRYIQLLFWEQNQEEGVKQIYYLQKENKILNDDFIQFGITQWLMLYYYGFNAPPIDLNKAESYKKQLYSIAENGNWKDEWERKLIKNYYSLSLFFTKISDEWTTDEIENLVKNFKDHPDKRFISDYIVVRLIYQVWDRKKRFMFTEAKEILLECLELGKKIGLADEERMYLELADGELMIGNLNEAYGYCKLLEEVSKKSKSEVMLRISYDFQSRILRERGDYEEAQTYLKKSQEVRDTRGDEQYSFFGYFNLFTLYYIHYRSSNNKIILKKAGDCLSEMTSKFSQSKRIPVQKYLELAGAIMNKHGSLLQKANSMNVLLQLKSFYPNDISIKLHLLDLFFDELVIIEEKEQTILQINDLFKDLGKNKFRQSPETIFDYVSQQMIIARYNYYIIGDQNHAFSIYNELITKLKEFNLTSLLDKVQQDMNKLEIDFDSWNKILKKNTDISERIEKSKFKNYIDEGLSLVGKNLK